MLLVIEIKMKINTNEDKKKKILGALNILSLNYDMTTWSHRAKHKILNNCSVRLDPTFFRFYKM